jgi:hypothetical protein
MIIPGDVIPSDNVPWNVVVGGRVLWHLPPRLHDALDGALRFLDRVKDQVPEDERAGFSLDVGSLIVLRACLNRPQTCVKTELPVPHPRTSVP